MFDVGVFPINASVRLPLLTNTFPVAPILPPRTYWDMTDSVGLQ